VLYNLLFNALDAQPLGGQIRVKADVKAINGGEPELILRIEDAGPGLPPELGDKVFEPFVSTKETGMGLGLSICRRIAESHSGHLTAQSVEAGGTAFVLRMPALPPLRSTQTSDPLGGSRA